MQGTETAILGVKLAFSLAAVVLIIFFVLRPIWRMLRTKPELADTFAQISQMPIEEDMELEIPTGDEKPDRLGLIQEARSDPTRTARLVSQWLKDRK